MTKEKQKLRETLRKLFALLGSPNKHEADTARQKIDELAAKYKMTWNDVIELVGIGAGDDDNAKTFDEFMQAMGDIGKKASLHPD
jgi:cupin superfamily acireductone dioxygenase involved in methionine salvage